MRLEAKAVSFAYSRRRHRPVLEQTDLAIETGERVGLLAPSGRGKTTLCRLLAGYERPDRGEILLEGRPLPRKGPCPVQLIWQHPEEAVDPLMRLRDALNEAAPAEALTLERLHIRQDWMDRYPSELSGGELQRFCIARALQPATRFLLCDEISAMLDLITQAQLWEVLLSEAEERGLGLLIVSHEPALLERICTRIHRL
ncbi:MAG: ATP-binding cassette domain-containing protein [Bacillota bacterium]|nr:ATP-binding cassette domain-containing protein [Bacillota bacterium]